MFPITIHLHWTFSRNWCRYYIRRFNSWLCKKSLPQATNVFIRSPWFCLGWSNGIILSYDGFPYIICILITSLILPATRIVYNINDHVKTWWVTNTFLYSTTIFLSFLIMSFLSPSFHCNFQFFYHVIYYPIIFLFSSLSSII